MFNHEGCSAGGEGRMVEEEISHRRSDDVHAEMRHVLENVAVISSAQSPQVTKMVGHLPPVPFRTLPNWNSA